MKGHRKIVFAWVVTVLLVGSLSILKGNAQAIPDQFYSQASKFPKSCMVQGTANSKYLALTFDDGPSEITPAILDLLEKYQIKATFFWQGKNLLEYPKIVKRAMDEGHEAGNHSWDHPNCADMNPEDLWSDQIQSTSDVYDSLFGLQVKLYRPPFGAVSDDQLEFLSNRGFTTVLWSVTTLDWDVERNSGEEIFQRFQKGLHPGAIVLLHDMDFDHSVSEKLYGIERLINHAQKEGYQFLSMTELKNNFQ